MLSQIFLYVGASFLGLWGISHLFPTRNVVRDFGEISTDNKHIITMEWIIEGLTLIFISVLVVTVTIIDSTNVVSLAVYWLTIAMLNILSLVSFLTGFKVDFLPFKLCPVIFTSASILIFLGILL